MKTYTKFGSKLAAMLCAATALSVCAADVTWTGADVTDDWFAPDNWGGAVPAAGDSVTIPAGASVVLSNSTPSFASISVSGTLVFTNWTTRLNATTVTIMSGGILTCAGPFADTEMSNRVWVACTDFTLLSGGKVDVNAKGYGSPTNTMAAFGPGCGTSEKGGGAHGGYGGSVVSYGGNGDVYGSVTEPEEPGSTGLNRAKYGSGSVMGGGVVRIDASGTVTLNGDVTANGNGGFTDRGESSGGSILVHADKIVANGGKLTANGGDAKNNYTAWGCPGGGGRIAVHYNASSQSAEDLVSLQVSAGAGKKYTYMGGAQLWNYGVDEKNADIGTVYFTDTKPLKFLGTSLTGQLHFGPGTKSYTADSLSMASGWVRFADEGFALNVTGDLSVSGTNTRLEMGGGTFLGEIAYTVPRLVSGSTPWALSVGGDMTINGGAWVRGFAASTNGVDKVGGTIDVAGDLAISGTTSSCTSTLYVACCPTNGAAVKVTAKNITIAEDALVSSSLRGFDRDLGPGKGQHNASTADNANLCIGSGHGGAGNAASENYGKKYDDENRPVLPGSGGGKSSWEHTGAPLSGGGVVHLVAEKTLTVNGRIEADACNSYPQTSAKYDRLFCGSGGSILLECNDFAMGSAAKVSAEGGNMKNGKGPVFYHGGCGGGGRIAVWTGKPYVEGETKATQLAITDVKPASYLGTFSVAGGLWMDSEGKYRQFDGTDYKITTDASEATVRGEDGTIRFVTVSGLGGFAIFVR